MPEHRHRDDLRKMAEHTLDIVQRNAYKVKNTVYKLRTEDLERSTVGYGPRSLEDWQPPPLHHPPGPGTYSGIVEVSTLACARHLARTLRNNPAPRGGGGTNASKKIG